MAALREMGLTAALLAATGGAAIATWSYFSARRRKAAARDTRPEHDTPILPQREPPGAGEESALSGPSADIPAQQVGEDRAGADTHSRHEAQEAAVPAAALTQGSPSSYEAQEAAVPAAQGSPSSYEAAVPAAALTQGSPSSHEQDTGCTAPAQPPVIEEISASHSCAHTPPQVKTSACKQVVVLGLDGSGKTSVLNSMAANKGNIVTTPTGGVNAMCFTDGNSKMEFLEIGGSEQLRPYWKMYLSRAFAVIFVVDAADHSRLPLAKRHLHQLIQQDAVLPLIVLANKQDLENAYHITEIHDALALSEICESRKLFLIGTHVTNGDSEISTGIQDTKEYLLQLFSEHPV